MRNSAASWSKRVLLGIALTPAPWLAVEGTGRADVPPAAPRTEPSPTTVVTADSAERGVVGVRGALTRGQAGGVNQNATGLVVAGYGDAFRGDGVLSARASHAFAIGGGTGGFEGALGGLFAFGLRVPLGAHGGAFARGAFRGELLGNDAFYFSRLELPEAQVGYQLITRDVQFEAGATLAPVLAGRFRVGAAATRDLGGTLAAGGFATVQTDRVQLSLDLLSVATDGESGAVRMAQGSLCLRAVPLGLCGDLRAIGDAGNGPAQQRVLYGGILVGLTGP